MSKWIRIAMLFLLVLLATDQVCAKEKDAAELYRCIREKILSVNDYVADVKMKVDVSFMRIPVMSAKMYFKSPSKIRLERKGGISILPKNSINLTLNSVLMETNPTVIEMKSETIRGRKVRILKVIPDNDQSGIVLTKLWIDDEQQIPIKIETTTINNGTVKMELVYGKYIKYALPDKITFYMDLKDYKLPKGVTMDYESNETELKKQEKTEGPQKGKIEIIYTAYKINTGLSNDIFNVKE